MKGHLFLVTRKELIPHPMHIPEPLEYLIGGILIIISIPIWIAIVTYVVIKALINKGDFYA
jgi:hypothetical protein